MTLSRLIPSLLVTALAIGAAAAPAQAQLNVGTGIVIEDIDFVGLNYNAETDLLTATGGTVSGTIAGLPFTSSIENFALQLIPVDGEICSVLDLELGPIDLDLLGLHVDTSRICLEITAIEGGGLLGDLLCGLAGGNLDLLGGLNDVLSEALTTSLAQADPPGQGAADICDGECEILDLALGPVDLTLLGLNVLLDNCEGGPVQVCVSASEGEGLLGDLLCGLAGGGILPDLGDLEQLVDAIFDGLELDLNNRQLNRLVAQVGRALADGELSAQEITRLTRTINKLVRQAA